MPENKKAKPAKNDNKSRDSATVHSSLQKQIDEIRNSTISLYNIMAKKGITTEKDFMTEYKKVLLKKKK